MKSMTLAASAADPLAALGSSAGIPSRRARALRAVRRLVSIRLVPLGIALVLLSLGLALGAPILAPYDPDIGDFSAVLSPPSSQHWLGTDELGRDVLSRLMFGGSISMMVGFGATILSTLIGATIGFVSGYRGGWIDEILMRVTDGMIAFPSLVLALAIASVSDPGIVSILVAIAIVSFSAMARLARASVLVVKEQEFVEAARTIGATPMRLLVRHIVPNSVAPLLVQFALLASYGILAEASLSFLGVGVRPPQSSWGSMLQSGYQYLEIAPWLSIVPGLAIFLTVLGLNLLGDGLRVLLNPREHVS